MTPRALSAVPTVRGPEKLQEFGRTRIITVVLLGTLSAALLTASAPRPVPMPHAAANPVVIASVEPEQAAITSRAPLRTSVAISQNIEALAGMVAKKYRISREATREFISTAYREGGRIGLDPLLIIAVMAVESRFNPVAESDAGAVGLMQIIPRYHAARFDATEGDSVLDPRTNIQLGAKVLKEYIKRAGTEAAGLQLYNGTPDDESNAYANKVLGEKQRLQQAVKRVRDPV